MKISHNWLANYLDVAIDTKNVSEILTDCGLEVEGVENIQSVKGGLEGLVIGEILSKEKHPDADRLNLTTVNVGGEESLNIVCGAPNVEVGQKVVVATIGTKLYSGEDSFVIKKSKIRGQLSEGMICAEDEIGLGVSHDGIMVLEPSVKVGVLAKDYFNVENDFVYEIGLTPNRSDAMGHIGVARDLAAVLSLRDRVNLVKPSVDSFKVDNNALEIDVEVIDNSLCPRYSGVTLSNIVVKESPDWLKTKLKSIGLSPINNVVDVTNFVMHETGQPLHAFNAAKISGNKIVVKTVEDKTLFKTLDDVQRELSSNDLMICNAKEPMCIAGVYGGIDSGVNHKTSNIFIESAYFNPVSIRKTAKRHGLNTDASFRYERGADPNITIYALKRAANLIKEIAGGEISSDIIDVYPNEIKHTEIEFTYATCNRIIGQEIGKEVIKGILLSLEIEINKETDEKLFLSVPPFRADVLREIDVIEEVLRIYGYNNVEVSSKMAFSLSSREELDKENVTNILSGLLISNGFNEMLSNSLTKSEYYDKSADTVVKMLNPLSSELNVMRQTMVFNGLEVIQYNQNRKNVNLKLFEFGKTYLKKNEQFEETNYLSLFLSGDFYAENWNTKKEETDFYHLKGFINLLFQRFGIDRLDRKVVEADSDFFQYGLKVLSNNKELAQFGLLKSGLGKLNDLNNKVFYAEVNFDTFLHLVKSNKIEYKELAKFPTVRRDLALLLDKDVSYSQIEEIALNQEKRLLKNVNLFDVYEGDNIEKGKKSYAISFLFQDKEKTLTDKRIDKTMEQIVKSITSSLGARLR